MSLTAAAAAWMLSGLTPSPLLNSLFAVVDTLPNFLPLPTAALASLWLQVVALGSLLLAALGIGKVPGLILLAIFVFSLGRRLGRPVFLDWFLSRRVVPMQRLQLGTEVGQVLGNLLAGILFPLGQATLQFLNALLLLLPLFREAQPSTAPTGQLSILAGFGFRRTHIFPLIQGMLLGALFALLPLWVRAIAQGNCLGFGILLAAYCTGRIVGNMLPLISPFLANLAIAALLWPLPQISSIPVVVLLFLLLGGLAALADQAIQLRLTEVSSDLEGWINFERLNSIGVLMGSLAFGLFAQATELVKVHPLLVLGFSVAALLQWNLRLIREV
jgi:hypothetical protein